MKLTTRFTELNFLSLTCNNTFTREEWRMVSEALLSWWKYRKSDWTAWGVKWSVNFSVIGIVRNCQSSFTLFVSFQNSTWSLPLIEYKNAILQNKAQFPISQKIQITKYSRSSRNKSNIKHWFWRNILKQYKCVSDDHWYTSISIGLYDIDFTIVQAWMLNWLFCDPKDCSPPGSFVHGVLQARILKWFAIPSSRGSSRPRDQIPVFYVSWIGSQVYYH